MMNNTYNWLKIFNTMTKHLPTTDQIKTVAYLISTYDQIVVFEWINFSKFLFFSEMAFFPQYSRLTFFLIHLFNYLTKAIYVYTYPIWLITITIKQKVERGRQWEVFNSLLIYNIESTKSNGLFIFVVYFFLRRNTRSLSQVGFHWI